MAQSVLPYQTVTISATARKTDKISEKCKATRRKRGKKRERELRIARDILIKILTAKGADREREVGEKDENELSAA